MFKLKELYIVLSFLILLSITTDGAVCNAKVKKYLNQSKLTFSNANSNSFVITSFMTFNDTEDFSCCIQNMTSGRMFILKINKIIENGTSKEMWKLYDMADKSDIVRCGGRVDMVKTETPDNFEHVCTEKSTKVEFFYASMIKFPGTLLLHACRLDIDENQKLFSRKSVIFLNGKNFEDFDLENRKVTNLNYPIFDERGLCLCDNILEYFDDCELLLNKKLLLQVKNIQKIIKTVFLVVGLVIIIGFCCWKIVEWIKKIKKNKVGPENIDLQTISGQVAAESAPNLS
jgi:hypothetical protein